VAHQPPMVSHPVRLAVLTFVGIAAFLAVCLLFAAEHDPVMFLTAGLAYGAFLALFGVGLCLALPGRVVRWWLISGALPLMCVTVFWLWLRSDPEAILRSPPGVMIGLLVVLQGWIVAGVLIAGWGWVRYVRWYRSSEPA
jgi:hypothetical protein